MSKPFLPFVETMITYACNLSCTGCSNYSDYNMKGSVRWHEGKSWIENWLDRIHIGSFGIMGGEPTLNPECKEWLYGVRELLPKSQIRFTTNGTNFVKNPDILDWCVDVGNTVFKFSIHEDKPYANDIVEYALRAYDWKPVSEYSIKRRYIGPNNTRLQINTPKEFFKTYKGTFGNMEPHNNNPKDAFDMCIQQTCPLLYEGKIYKCSSIALLNRVLEDWKQPITADWQYYTDYKGISTDSAEEEIEQFIQNFGKPHSICRMCPTRNDTESILDHQSNVISKKQWIKHNQI